MVERRSQARFLDTELVMLSWVENGVTLKQLGNVQDVSLSGMGIIVDDALPEGMLLSITYGNGSLTGIVRHHTDRGQEHFVGIELGALSRDSRLHFDPELLVR